jgi:hypothetical protein
VLAANDEAWAERAKRRRNFANARLDVGRRLKERRRQRRRLARADSVRTDLKAFCAGSWLGQVASVHR